MKTKKISLKALLSSPHLQPKRSIAQLQKKSGSVFKTRLVVLSGMLLALSSLAFAGGAASGGASEVTQIMNNVQLANQYSQQVQQYSTQLQQYQSQLQDLKLNPTSTMSSDVQRLVHGIGGVMSAGQSVGGTMAQIDGNFSKTFKSPLAGTFSENFKTWTTSSQDTLGGAMRAAGLHRDAYATDTAALAALYNKTQTSQGTVAAVQTLSEVNVMQVQQMQKLQDLVATQNVASSAYMAGQNSKEQAKADDSEARLKASHDRFQHEKSLEGQAELAKQAGF